MARGAGTLVDVGLAHGVAEALWAVTMEAVHAIRAVSAVQAWSAFTLVHIDLAEISHESGHTYAQEVADLVKAGGVVAAGR